MSQRWFWPVVVALTLALAGGGYVQARDYVAGYLDMTVWANPNILTNYTVGFFVMFAMIGILVGKLLEFALLRAFPKMERRKLMMIIMPAVIFVSFMFAQFMGMAGMIPGVRLAG